MFIKLEYSDEVIRLEIEGDYLGALNQTYSEWLADQTESKLLSAMLEHWFVIFNLDKFGKEFDQWKELWNMAYEKIEDPVFSFFLGYIMKTSSYLFLGKRFGYGGESLDTIWNLGNKLREEAYKRAPECAVFRIGHIYQQEHDYYRQNSDEELSEIRDTFPVPSIVNEYFRRIFNAEDDEICLPKFEDYRNNT